MQNTGDQHNTISTEPGFLKARRFIQERIYNYLMQRKQSHEIAPENLLDIVRRLEEGLFILATTKEEHANLETLEIRLLSLIKSLPFNNQNQQYQQQGNTSVPMMIPNTGGMPQNGNLNTVVPRHNVSSDGGMINGYQQSTSNFFDNSGGNIMLSSIGAQRMAIQMIPTPGLKHTNNTSNQPYMDMDSSSTIIDSTRVFQPLQQKQEDVGQYSHMASQKANNLPMMNSSEIQIPWRSRSQVAPCILANVFKQNVEEEVSQRMSGLNLN